MIRLENVTKTYKGSVVALRDIALDIQKQEFVFLVGPTGSGKSTLIRLLIKEDTPDSGRIWGYELSPASNSLEVFIKVLRRKTEADGEPRLLQTVRGFGVSARPPRCS